jgi:drug/metabolite transporter (DMT)-like permease
MKNGCIAGKVTELEDRMDTAHHAPRWKTLLAYSIIYFVWGSTFYAIRVGVMQVPPLLFAALRFTPAGAALVAAMRISGICLPRMREWGSILVIAFLIFGVDYGLLFWAEQRVPSGPAAVMMATIPAFMALAEIVILGTQKMTVRLAGALAIGLGGVAILVSRSLNLGGAPIDFVGAASLIVGSISWSIASALSRKLPLPGSKVMSSGAQMLAGGVMLAIISAMRGEWSGFSFAAISASAWIACAYLAIVGSIIGFTAYVWLIHRESPTRVGTYAYVNPLVAILIGYFLGGESLGLRTVLGTICVLASVVVITRLDSPKTS